VRALKEIGMNMLQLSRGMVTVAACLLSAWAAAQVGGPGRPKVPNDSPAPPVPGTLQDTAASPIAPPSVDCSNRAGTAADALCGSLQSSGTGALSAHGAASAASAAASSAASAPRRKPHSRTKTK